MKYCREEKNRAVALERENTRLKPFVCKRKVVIFIVSEINISVVLYRCVFMLYKAFIYLV